MNSIKLGNTGRVTSRLGYGCSSLMGALDRRKSLALLEVAYAGGIRHFDVAPMYGYGEAEGCLGDFIAQHRGEVTVATKFGLLPASGKPWLRAARRAAGAMLRHLPALKQRLAPASDAIAGAGAKARFDVASARLSLESSLRNLRSDHIDVWLLHEAEADDLTDDALLRFLQDSRDSGKIGSFGIGSEASKTTQLLSERPAYCPVLQFEWSLFDAQLAQGSAFRIHHRSLSTRFRALHESLCEKKQMQMQWSSQIGIDLGREDTLAALMLKAAEVMNPASIILFSAKSAAKIRSNVRTEEDASLAEPALRLHHMLRSQAVSAMHGPFSKTGKPRQPGRTL